MPEQRGKRRNRPGHRSQRGGALHPAASAPAPTPTTPSSSTARPTRRRRGIQFPWWANGLVGLLILVFGVYYVISPLRGTTEVVRVIITVLYFGLAALYLSKAYRQRKAGV